MKLSVEEATKLLIDINNYVFANPSTRYGQAIMLCLPDEHFGFHKGTVSDTFFTINDNEAYEKFIKYMVGSV